MLTFDDLIHDVGSGNAVESAGEERVRDVLFCGFSGEGRSFHGFFHRLVIGSRRNVDGVVHVVAGDLPGQVHVFSG